ncbi:MAG: 5-formyltetrahydrofolate cyclo-ligase [Gammaproteobacteria bacterium]|nr:5-formyltetrahydrofolate cyclo-ligase [Gammaproteobacteria bacterium]
MRARLRNARTRLAVDAVARASDAAANHLAASAEYAGARRIAAYVAVGNELDPAPALARAHADGKEIYLPCILPQRKLRFARWRPGDSLRESRLGIPEPAAAAATIDPGELDLVIVPLVGFDKSGNRLGNGGGYYDRNFGFLLRRRQGKPVLAGYAHAMQECPRIETNEWDVPLALVVTETGIRHFVPGNPPAARPPEIGT